MQYLDALAFCPACAGRLQFPIPLREKDIEVSCPHCGTSIKVESRGDERIITWGELSDGHSD